MGTYLDINIGDVVKCAEELRNIKTEFKSETKDLYSKVDQIHYDRPGTGSIWWGNRAKEFVTNVNSMKKDFEAISAKIEEYANWLDDSAKQAKLLDTI